MATRSMISATLLQDTYVPAGLDACLAAARNGDPEAYYDLGLMFSSGNSVEVDLVEAHKWFNLAVIKGMDAAKSYRAELASEMTMEEISAAQKSAREWLAGDSTTH